ncbi:MAG: amidophosphoribosyltransferase [Cardiobacteriaceae bacterium]|nr:amidophosphoribosyltransferase [Cardiobacteriaceae bacterium]
MCGVVGIVGKNPVAQDLYDALIMLQHRGQDAAGITTSKQGRFFMRKSNGLVSEVFREKDMQNLVGNIGIGHIRYPTAGSSSSAEAQPMYVNSPYGIVMAHNGNLTNAAELIPQTYQSDLRHINTHSDSEILLNVLANELAKNPQFQPTPEQIFSAVERTHKRLRGAYAVVALISGFGLIAFRDIYAIRPLIYGRRETDNGAEFMVASESVALQAQGFAIERDLEPGECLIITEAGEVYSQKCAENAERISCIFEYVYFARPDSTIDGINVYKSRLRMGEKLANRILEEWGENHEIDVVIPIPDTSRSSAIELANRLGVKFREGFMKNRYIGRTFIMPGQKKREKSVRQKLSALELEFRNKNVLLVDDSIVRGTTSGQIVQMAREAGAKKVFFASAAPPVRFPNVYGIDMPSADELVAHSKSVAEICSLIGADRLIYQTLEDLIDCCTANRHSLTKKFECSIFTGEYITGDINEKYLEDLKNERRKAKSNTNDNLQLVAYRDKTEN